MKHALNRLALAGLLAVAACYNAPPAPDYTLLGVTYTLQGTVADAITGARLGGDLKLYLVQGPEVRGPSRLLTSGDLMGEYAFTGIPAAFNVNNILWKVVAIRTGYERFESEIPFQAQLTAGALVDQVYSRIGNIYMWPLGTAAPDYVYTVTFNGKPVPGAIIQLDPVVGTNNKLFGQSPAGSTLPATNGYLSSLQGTTDAAGKFTFTGATLGLGAAYTAQVLPVVFTETPSGTKVQLGLTIGTTIVVGLANTAQTVALSDVVTPTTNPIFVVSTSNQVTGQVQSTGALVITFNSPVTLQNPNGFAAATSSATAVFAAQQVNATLSADGLTLTVTPNFTTPPGAAERNVTVTYANGTAYIVPRDYPATSLKVFPGAPAALAAITFTNGTDTVNPTVFMVGP